MAGEARRRGTLAERRAGAGARGGRAAEVTAAALAALRRAAGVAPYRKRVAKVPKRERAKLKRRIKKQFGYTRRDVSRIGAGHREATDAYVDALVDAGI